ncbi:hypothetical protein DQ04_05441030 [Trypanosoma grayi]|uniref:hypothetical protein n=1 Tax=Trypanosoma grayi TaxID=71804 RepID=UPI0004F49F50|nr:hypothetical protein DQ04_05441030 [Trypanosoma grayi]KEG09311.1 hypothetical protein DQ04_05441030 [Trypanosoma grayi]
MRNDAQQTQASSEANTRAATVGKGDSKSVDVPSLMSTGLFQGRVESVYDRMQAREQQERREQLSSAATCSPSAISAQDDQRSTMAQRRRDPMVSLALLERMRLVFDLCECRQQRKQLSVSCFDNPANGLRGTEDELADVLRWKQQQEHMQQRLGAENGRPRSAGTVSTSASDSPFPGIPFSVFEREILEPFFDAFFPPEKTRRPPTASFLDGLDDGTGSLVLNMTTSKSTLLRAPSRSQLLTRSAPRSSYERRRASHVEAAENLFCVMDTNGDGFLSWDELSSYILQSGQRLLLADEYRGAGKTVAPTGTRGKSISDGTKDYAGRALNYAPTPTNSGPWQQQYPLVRYLYHTEPISRLIFVNRGRRYITAAWDGLVKMWRPEPRLADARGKPAIVHERNLFAAGAPIMDMVLASAELGDAEVLTLVAMDGTVTLLRVGTGEVLKTFIGRAVEPVGVAMSSPCIASSATHQRKWRPENLVDNVAVGGDIRDSMDSATVVLRPEFKVRAYRREAIEMFFTDVSRYFNGLDVVAPTYEHLERRQSVKADVLAHFGGEVGHLGEWSCSKLPVQNGKRQHIGSTTVVNQQGNVGGVWNDHRDSNGRDVAAVHNSDSDDDGCYDDDENDGRYGDAGGTGRHQRREGSALPMLRHRRRGLPREGDKSWFACSVALAKYEATNSSSVLPSGVFLLLGFETGVLQMYSMRPQWFTISNLSLTRVEPSTVHEPVLTLSLHRAAITSIITHEPNDLLMTASDDGRVIVRHMSRVQMPFVTLGDGVPIHGVPPPLHSNGHTKRITCMCWNAARNLVVTGGADRYVTFWAPSSSRQLYRVDLRSFSTSSGTTGYAIDVSFLQPPRQPLLVLVLDSKRMLYFFDTVSYQCLHILRDETPASLRAGEMLRARYDAVDDRLILGGRYLRVWESQQRDEYPHDYRGHRRAIVGLAFQRNWSFWVSADDSVIIIWNADVADLQAQQSEVSEPKTEESVSTDHPKQRRTTAKLVNDGCRWALATGVARSWCVEGGICHLAVEQTESAHIFVALLRKRCIVEYNSFSGSVLRTFDFPANMGEIASLACGVAASGASFMHPTAFLCGTFEREQSANGTTALYALSSQGSTVADVGSTGGVHRSILTNEVGVSCAVIVASLGLVVVGHRGGISVTPVDEATTCPIPCLRLTDRPTKKNDTKKSGASEVRRSLVAPNSTGGSGIIQVKRRSLALPPIQPQLNSHCRALPHLDLVALFPGALLHDPVAITRECMQQRERYLFCDEVAPTTSSAHSSSSLSDANEGSAGCSGDSGRNGCDISGSEELPPLLLFSEEFIASAGVLGSSFGMFLREQLATLGFVGQIVSIGETGYVTSGSDDGLVQFWNLRTMSEVMRFRVTHALDAVTAMDMSDNASHLAVGDANGHVVLLDLSGVNWLSAMPLEMVTGVEDGVHMLQRWRGHRQSVTSVRFVRQTRGFTRHGTLGAFTLHRSSHVSMPIAASSEARGEGSGVSSSSSAGNAPIFVCTSSEDSYIYAWCWEPGPCLGGSVHCIGCFGGGVEVPPSPPLGKLTDSAWQVFEVVRKVYLKVRLLKPGGVLNVPNMRAAIHRAVVEIMEDIRTVKARAPLLQRTDEAAVESAAEMETTTRRRSITMDETASSERRVTLGRERRRSRTRSRSRSGSRGRALSLTQHAVGTCPTVYALAFEEGQYHDRGLVELIERLVTELRGSDKKQKTATAVGAGVQKPELQPLTSTSTSKEDTDAASPRGEVRRATLLPSTGGSTACSTTSASRVFESTSSGPLLQQNQSLPAASGVNPLSRMSSLSSCASRYAALTQQQQQQGQGQEQGERLEDEVSTAAAGSICLPRKASDAFSLTLSGGSEPPPSTIAPAMVRRNRAVEVYSPSSPLAQMQSPIPPQDEYWGQLPPITVSYETATPLPRLRCANAGDGASTASDMTVPHCSLAEGLPPLSQIIGHPMDDKDGAPRRGVKVLLKEKATRHACHSFFFEHLKESTAESPTVSARSGDPDQLSNARRERRRKSALWGPARVMATLMSWRAPRMSPTTSCGSDTDRSILSAGVTEASSVALPMFLPLSLGTGHDVAAPTSLELERRKSLVLTLQEEMEAMKTILHSTLHQKQLLMAEERATLGGGVAAASGGRGGGGR